jgi:hypothetical protein
MIEMHDAVTGLGVLVNPQHVACVSDEGEEGCKVIFSSNVSLYVEELYESVKQWLITGKQCCSES